jgi:hypothetical protein
MFVSKKSPPIRVASFDVRIKRFVLVCVGATPALGRVAPELLGMKKPPPDFSGEGFWFSG